MLKKYQIRTSRNISSRLGQKSEPKRIMVLAGVIVVLVVVLLILRLGDNSDVLDSYGCVINGADENIAAADLIVVGSVFAVVPAGEQADVLFEPTILYQGSLPERGVIIASWPVVLAEEPGETSEVDDLHFSSSQSPYLLYLKERSDGRYNTSRCFGSRFLEAGLTAEEQLILGDGLLVP